MDDLFSLFKEKKAIVLSSIALGPILFFYGFRIFIPAFFAHLVFCGYLGYQDAKRERNEIEKSLKDDD